MQPVSTRKGNWPSEIRELKSYEGSGSGREAGLETEEQGVEELARRPAEKIP